jgi:hypothetical protein
MPSPTPIAKSTSILWQGKVYAPLAEIVEGLHTRKMEEAVSASRLERTVFADRAGQKYYAAEVLNRVAEELVREFGEEVEE